MNSKLRSAIDKVAEMNAQDQDIYVIEECSELIKELAKIRRGQADAKDIFEEACDVLATVLVLLYDLNVSEKDIFDQIMFKLNRAILRDEHIS